MDKSSPAVLGPVESSVRPAAEARWYCLDRYGVAMLCKDEADAQAQVIENDDCWPGRAPHRAALLGDVGALHAELRHARDGLTKGRSRMREDNERLSREAHTCSKAAETYAAEAERLRAVLLKIEAGEYLHLPTMVREALGPNVLLSAPSPTGEVRSN